ncbi:MAG: histidine kinase [Nocardioides sp.]|uniref:sensor histidine kinase n=1 Tax=Nocardioides sp. TaxID=35761 RepID=UPI0039E543B4
MRSLSLFWKVCATNGAVFLAGTLVLALSPARVSEDVLASEAVVLAVGLAVIIALNGLLLRRSLAPVDRLIRTMDSVRLANTGQRQPSPRSGPAALLVESYNAMLDRLERERAASAARELSAQEAERHRIAQELHDEIGQSLTVVLLGLKRLADQLDGVAPPDVVAEVGVLRDSARHGLDDIRRVARRLRPGVLDDLGLHSALAALCSDVSAAGTVRVTRTFGRGLPALDRETELVVYRVAQEALTNVVRHAGTASVAVSLTRLGERVVLEVVDDGAGRGDLTPGAGIVGMHERARLVGGDLEVATLPGHGTRVRLSLPIPAAEHSP